MDTLRAGTPAALVLTLLATVPATAQVQLNVCGVPPLPPCERPRPRVEERVIIERDRGDPDLGTLCRTRALRCRIWG